MLHAWTLSSYNGICTACNLCCMQHSTCSSSCPCLLPLDKDNDTVSQEPCMLMYKITTKATLQQLQHVKCIGRHAAWRHDSQLLLQVLVGGNRNRQHSQHAGLPGCCRAGRVPGGPTPEPGASHMEPVQVMPDVQSSFASMPRLSL